MSDLGSSSASAADPTEGEKGSISTRTLRLSLKRKGTSMMRRMKVHRLLLLRKMAKTSRRKRAAWRIQ